MRTASTKFIAGPAKTIRNRAASDLLLKALAGSTVAALPPSSGFSSSPIIFTYPPIGIRDRQYSVSLPRNRQSTGPKPTENRSTPTPQSRAMKKWPSSCTMMRMPRTTTNETSICTVAMRLPISTRPRPRRAASPAPPPASGCQRPRTCRYCRAPARAPAPALPRSARESG